MVRDVVVSLSLVLCVALGVSGCGNKEAAKPAPADAKPAAAKPADGAAPAAGKADPAKTPAANNAKAAPAGDSAAAAATAPSDGAKAEAAPKKPGLLPDPPSLKLKGGSGDDFTLGGSPSGDGKPKPKLLDTKLGNE